MSLAENLRSLMQEIPISENELARKTGVRQPIINRILTGKNQNPQIDTLRRLSVFFSLNISQLIGEESMELANLGIFQRDTSSFSKVQLLELENVGETIGTKNKYREYVYVDIPLSPEAFAVKLADLSMEPRFPPGTVVIFDRKIEIKDRSYIILLPFQEKKAIFRQLLILEGGNKFAVSINPTYKDFRPIDCDKGDLILGTMIRAIYDDVS